MARPCGPRGAEEDAYRVVAVLRSRCDGCRRCQEACPHGALRVD
jgi:Fe-S-cluster-containing hydrogenase component 2